MTRPKVVAKTELGAKRTCANCGTKFYDLKRSPIVCPKCEAVYQQPVERASRAPAAAKVKPVAPEESVIKEVPVEEGLVKEAPVKESPELVSLEEAEQEQAPAKRTAETSEEDDFEIEAAPLDDDADDPFLTDDEDENEDDVTGLIGGSIAPDTDET